MSNPNRSISIELTANINKLKAKLAEATKAIKEVYEQAAGYGKSVGAGTVGVTNLNLQQIINEYRNLNAAQDGTRQNVEALSKSMEAFGLTAENQKSIMSGLGEVIGMQLDNKISKTNQSFKFLKDSMAAAGFKGSVLATDIVSINKALENYRAKNSATGKALTALQAGFSKTGKDLQWFGFRLMMLGRIFSRSLMVSVKKVVRQFTNWDRTITQIGTGMGFLAASGMQTAGSYAMMVDGMKNATKTGMAMQGVMAQISALFMNIGADILPAILPAISALITAFQKVWSNHAPAIMDVMKGIAEVINNTLIPIVEDVGGVFMEELAKGLKAGVEGFAWLINAIKPVLPTIAWLLGKLIGLAPVLTMVGAAMFGTSVIFTGLGLAMKWGVPLIKGVILVAKMLGIVVGGLGLPITAVIVALGLLWAAWRGNWFGIRDIVHDVWDSISPVFDSISNAFEGVGESVKGAMDWLKNFGKADNKLVTQLESEYGNSIGDTMAAQYEVARAGLEALQMQSAPPSSPQTVNIDIGFTGTNISSEMDLDNVVDAVSRALADRMESVFS